MKQKSRGSEADSVGPLIGCVMSMLNHNMNLYVISA